MKQSRFTDVQIIGFLKQADAGIDRTYASQIERVIVNPSLKVICSLASALDVEPSSLIGLSPIK
jgi:transcriptional regulator with XRE-family HTH domain